MQEGTGVCAHGDMEQGEGPAALPTPEAGNGGASGGGEQREGSLAKEGEGDQGSLKGGMGPWSSISAAAPREPKSQHKQEMGTGWNAWQAHRG